MRLAIAVVVGLFFMAPAFASAEQECRPILLSAVDARRSTSAQDAAQETSEDASASLSETTEAEHCTVSRRRNECRVLSKQISYFHDVVEMARGRDNEQWETATLRHIERLETRRVHICGDADGLTELAGTLGNAAATAARLAAQAVTLGAF